MTVTYSMVLPRFWAKLVATNDRLYKNRVIGLESMILPLRIHTLPYGINKNFQGTTRQITPSYEAKGGSILRFSVIVIGKWLIFCTRSDIPWHSHPCGATRPANENHTSKLHFLRGAVSRRDRRDDSAGFNQEAAHTEFGMPGFIRAAWLYKVPLSSRPESRRCIFVGMEWRDLASRGTDEPY